MNYAVVDTGSNTIRMSVYEVCDGEIKEIYTKAIFANLAGHIVENRITDEGISVCCEALCHHRETAKKYNAEYFAFATAAIRNAENSGDAVEKIFQKTGIKMEILSGDDEGTLSFSGAYDDFGVTSGVMADVGGGSSEVIVFNNGEIESVCSVPWGSLKAYKNFVSGEIPTKEEAENIKNEIKRILSENINPVNIKDLCLVGGGVRIANKLCSMFFPEDTLNRKTVDGMLDSFINNSDIMEIFERIAPKRKYTIIPALAIYSAIGEFFETEKIAISDKGIKEGYLKKRIIH